MSKNTRESDKDFGIGHKNHLRLFWREFIIVLSHWPSLMFAVVFRKNLGERYYTLASSVTFSALLLLPLYWSKEITRGLPGAGINIVVWCLFVGAFLYFSVLRRLEFKRKSRIISTERFSYYEGDDRDTFWLWLSEKVPFIKFDYYNIHRYYEPLLALILGVILFFSVIGVFVGTFLIIIAFLQYFRVAVQYAKGKDFLMDKIDRIIAKQNMRDTILFDKPASQTQGFNIFAPRPESPEIREKIVDQIFKNDDDNTVTL